MVHNHVLNFHLPHLGRRRWLMGQQTTVPPKGWMAVTVGGEGEQQKFVVPVVYLHHPMFLSLLKEAEKEYGFDHKGAICIPCHVEYFRQIQGIINQDTGVGGSSSRHGRGQGHHHPHILTCFRA